MPINQEVLEGLLEFGPNFYEFGFETPLKGDTVATARQGDRLYTDDDWLTSDLLAAKESYQGKPRPSRWNEQKTILAIGEPDEIVDVFDENGRIVGQEHRWTK